MRIVAQRVSRAGVSVGAEIVGKIGLGLCILLGVGSDDTDRECLWIAEKAANLRIFEDPGGRMNRSLLDVGGEALIISQFTLYADCGKGRRPSFTGAAAPGAAKNLYESFVRRFRDMGITAQTGVFGATMSVDIINEGPVTIILDTADMPDRRGADI
ncbi:MAG: D-tyrosyl-tRNA(Tyr) deacylase [Synergistaceae bacterium]|jgi:D-tyrosyl-tRNA(Tyr) deacylase|nr:D-tyrosyl-tRNA(Tyr) deacylase [Synergistaceae bacterium]